MLSTDTLKSRSKLFRTLENGRTERTIFAISDIALNQASDEEVDIIIENILKIESLRMLAVHKCRTVSLALTKSISLRWTALKFLREFYVFGY